MTYSPVIVAILVGVVLLSAHAGRSRGLSGSQGVHHACAGIFQAHRRILRRLQRIDVR